MPDIVCKCIYEAYTDPPMSIWTTLLDFFCSVVIGVLGVIINCKFIEKLQEEKRAKPSGRKGNVIEPIMQLFCKFQIIFWPYYLLYLWIHLNGIAPASFMNGWWCNIGAQITIKFGRMTIAWNSFFVAFIRYVYIVHREKSNQWDFDQACKWFRVASIVIPTIFNTIDLFSQGFWEYQHGEAFKNCIAINQGLNNTSNMTIPNIYPYALTVEYLPQPLVRSIYYINSAVAILILSNLADGYLYFSIFRCIKR